jgi:negative regulator of flagellin synthesis FlgM
VTSAKVRLSDRAQDIKKIKEQVNSLPDVDESKVAKYKSMLAKGEYKIQPDKVAEKMVNEHAYNAFFDTDDK